MYLLCLTGLLGIAITGDAFNAFVFLEISSLSTYVLIALGRDRRALVAAFQYLIMGTIGATFYVIGVGCSTCSTGTLNMVDMAARLAPAWADSSRPIVAALAFMTVGISLKLALVPAPCLAAERLCLRAVVGDRLPRRPPRPRSRSTCWCASSSRSSASSIDFSALPVAEIIIALSLAAMFIASLIAVFEPNLKRMLAYSSVAQIGYITLGIGLANQAGLTGGLVHVVNHALMKAALFLAVGAIFYRVRTVQLGGARRHRPQDAAHHGGVHDRRLRPRRHARHRRVHLQMVSGRRRAREGLVGARSS